jgi:hypothetical protein
MNTTGTFSPKTDQMADTDFVSGRWEPCVTFASDDDDSQVCGDCGWFADDHRANPIAGAVIHRLPARAPRPVQPRRLAS